MKIQRRLLKNLLFLLILTLTLTASLMTLAGSGDASALSPEEKAIRVLVRTRGYIGGADEDPLKVQAQLPNPNRKMQPAQEPVEEDAAAHGTDSND